MVMFIELQDLDRETVCVNVEQVQFIRTARSSVVIRMVDGTQIEVALGYNHQPAQAVTAIMAAIDKAAGR